MKFKILSRADIKNGLLPDEPFAWISFCDFDKAPVSLHNQADRNNCEISTLLRVDDLIPGHHVTSYENVFSDTHAWLVIDTYLLAKEQKLEVVVCQCEAGLSRSAGAAAALCLLDEQSDAWIYKSKHPNVHIKNTILRVWREAWGGSYDDKEKSQ